LATEFRRLAAGSKDGSQVWLNWVSFDEQQPVGTLQATVFAETKAIIAYVVFRPFWGQRFGSQGCRWLLRELFERRAVREVVAYVDPRNIASLRLLEAAGLSPRKTATDVVFELSLDGWRTAITRTRVRG
jgi:RimJ/RimL family protein N-acetyltransferase